MLMVLITALYQAAEMVVEEISCCGGEAMVNGASVTDSDQVYRVWLMIVMDKYGRIDILINNAGILEIKKLF